MIAHIATFTFRNDVPAAWLDELAIELRAIAATCPSIRFYECGPNLRLRPDGADFAVLAIVEDRAALDAYLDSPAHIAIAEAEFALTLVGRQAAQLELGDRLANRS